MVPLFYIFIWDEMLQRTCTQVNFRKEVQNPVFEQKWNCEAHAASRSPSLEEFDRSMVTSVGESVKKILGNKYVVRGVISKVSIIMISCHDDIWLCNPDTEMVATQNTIN